jgi:hypothetical protein
MKSLILLLKILILLIESMYVVSPSIIKKVSNFDLAIAEGDEEDLKDQLRAGAYINTAIFFLLSI